MDKTPIELFKEKIDKKVKQFPQLQKIMKDNKDDLSNLLLSIFAPEAGTPISGLPAPSALTTSDKIALAQTLSTTPKTTGATLLDVKNLVLNNQPYNPRFGNIAIEFGGIYSTPIQVNATYVGFNGIIFLVLPELSALADGMAGPITSVEPIPSIIAPIGTVNCWVPTVDNDQAFDGLLQIDILGNITIYKNRQKENFSASSMLGPSGYDYTMVSWGVYSGGLENTRDSETGDLTTGRQRS